MPNNEDEKVFVLELYELVEVTGSDDLYIIKTKLFDSHDRGLLWLVDNYGDTMMMYSGEYKKLSEISCYIEDTIKLVKVTTVVKGLQYASDLNFLFD